LGKRIRPWFKTLESGEHPDSAPQRIYRNPDIVIALNFPPLTLAQFPSTHYLGAAWRELFLIDFLVSGD
jgi:hypothetical protein